MLKQITIFLVAMLFATAVFAVGPGQIWRLEITASNSDLVEIAELDLLDENEDSVIDFKRTFSFEEANPAGAATWNISHNLGIQRNSASVDTIA